MCWIQHCWREKWGLSLHMVCHCEQIAYRLTKDSAKTPLLHDVYTSLFPQAPLPALLPACTANLFFTDTDYFWKFLRKKCNTQSSDLWSPDGLTVLEIVIILLYYQPSYKHFTHTMKPIGPLLLDDVALRGRMYPAGKVNTSQHLAIPGFPQSDHTVGKPSADAGSLCSEA